MNPSGKDLTATVSAMCWIDNARILAIFAVVLLHVSAQALTENAVGSTNWWVGAFFNSATRWGVPVFVLLSGALLLGRSSQEGARDFYRKRASRVLVPLLFWSLAFVLWVALKTTLKGGVPDWASLGRRLLSGQPYYHLWFLYMILGLYLLTPFLRLLFERAPDRQVLQLSLLLFALVGADAVYQSVQPERGRRFILVWCFDYLPYFCLGGFLARWRGTLPGRGLTLALACAAPVFAFLGYSGSVLGDQPQLAAYFHDNLGLTTVLGAVAISLLLLRGGEWRLLGAANAPLGALVFGIYLMHPLVLESLRLTRFQTTTAWGPAYAALLLLVAAAVFGITALLAWLISRLPGLRRII
jgi:surface polysaccharide O-acyltransferase-like enzyme